MGEISTNEIALIFKKLTQKLKFNLYEIDEEIDVFVTFETMNNRGKPLTSLELLKNRLIYLSTLFKDNDGRDQLRVNINDAWKTMYEYLGKNPEAPLDDDLFLRNHWTMYFKYTRRKGDDYIKFLLDEKFNARNITHPKNADDEIQIEEISEYVKSLQQSVVCWFYMHNPYHAQENQLTDTQKLWLSRLDRLSFRSFKPLILSAFVSKQDPEMIRKLLEAAERYNFTLFNLSQRRANTGDTEFFTLSRELLTGSKSIEEVVATIDGWINYYYDPERFLANIEEKYELGGDGFYYWDGIRYFLYEHEQWLREKRKQATSKLSWEVLKTNKKDHVTLEHIFPQTPDNAYWIDRFGHLNEQEKRALTHSLGNLLPLSRSKNSSLQNDSFPQKVNNGDGVGYYNGSVSENEVAQNQDWTPVEILNRGLELLGFMEQRWNIELGDMDFKGRLLHLDEIEIEFEIEMA
ncbi:HNH endonuclease family protein [Endozoicomonas ascidiicola]|uniref:HNH endonuclease family protein n=1 Tax=Endozoicomonas ascidiicola TaxID=1698521 RepID=UPI000AA239D5|nr:HNH endonuclease family protein [Endozoicomonas ascidiicola]